jgi:hypothetical protein
VEDRFGIKPSSWIGKTLSYGDQLILINSVLIIMLYFLQLPNGYGTDQISTGLATKKYIHTKWNIIYRSKEQGGLGIEVLKLKYKCSPWRH